MRFIDEARVFVHAGKGGNGAIAFLREKFRPFGGPSGGNGGRGGSVIFQVDEGLSTLLDFKYQPRLIAKDGEDGRGKEQYGHGADDIVVRVPPGTIVFDEESGKTLADLVMPGDTAVIAQGGEGGLGNMHFASSTRRSPRIATPGTAGGRGGWPRGTSERGQIDAADRAQRGAAEDRALPFHYAGAEYRPRFDFGRGKFHARGYSRADRGSAQGAGVGYSVPAAHHAHAADRLRDRRDRRSCGCVRDCAWRDRGVRSDAGGASGAGRAEQDRSARRGRGDEDCAQAAQTYRSRSFPDFCGEERKTGAAGRCDRANASYDGTAGACPN